MAKVEKTETVVVCDVCGDRANGSWNGVEYLNDRVATEYSCPIDLCEDHMVLFSNQFSHYKVERYEGVSEEKQSELISKMKEHN